MHRNSVAGLSPPAHHSSVGGLNIPSPQKTRTRSILFNENVSSPSPSPRHDSIAFAPQSAVDASVGSDAAQGRARRVTAAMMLVRSMLQQQKLEGGQEQPSTVVESLEEAIMNSLPQASRPSQANDLSSLRPGQTHSVIAITIGDKENQTRETQFKPVRFGAVDEGSESGSESLNALDPQVDIGAALRDHLFQGTNLATLAGLLTSNTFSLKDRRVDQLFGEDVPLSIRKVVIQNMIAAIDNVWERLGWMLLEKLGSFEKAFRWLDKDGSGSIDRAEFIYAYVTLHLSSQFTLDGEDETGIANLAFEGKKSVRRSTLFEQGTGANDQLDLKSKAKERGSRSASVFVGGSAQARRSSVAQTKDLQTRTTLKQGNQDTRLRRMVLKADAEFLFHMMHAGERGLTSTEDDDEDNSVTMRHLVMRVTGLDSRTMENLRTEIMAKCGSMQLAFQEFAADKQNMRCDEFTGLYHHLFGEKQESPENNSSSAQTSRSPSISAPPGSRQSAQIVPPGSAAASPTPAGRPSLTANIVPDLMPSIPAEDEDTQNYVASQLEDFGRQDLKVTERALRIFKGIDVDGSGTLSLAELRHALSPHAPSTTFSIFRRRVLLQYGSFENLISAQPSAGLVETSELEAFAFEFDLNGNDGYEFAERIGIKVNDEVTHTSSQTSIQSGMPADSFSVQEFAIVLFLVKPEAATMEEFLSKLGRLDRDKDMHFREFQDRMASLIQARVAGAKAKAAAGKAAAKTNRISTLPFQLGESVTSWKVKELRTIYEMLEREHRRVSVNILLEAMRNVSDCLALDRSTYQTGDHIVCRIRLSEAAQKKCRERPFIAIVPERLKWQDAGRGQWLCDGVQVQDLTDLCDKVYEVPRTNNGVPRREAWLRIIVPATLACAERYEVRLFASTNGRELGKQVGRSVPFDLLMPQPESPLVDQVSLGIGGAEEASVVLHWTPPPGNFRSSPIVSFIVHVEPLIYRHELSVDKVASAKEVKDESSDSESDEDDDTYKQIIVWSPKINGFQRKLSYRIQGLQRGVQYRFGIQCVHATAVQSQSKDDKQSVGVTEVRGALSELSDIITMPLYHVTSPPGAPQVHQLASGMIELAWIIPDDEDTVTNRIFQYCLEYRHAGSDSEDGRKDSKGSDVSDSSYDDDAILEEDEETDSSDNKSEVHRDSSASSNGSLQADDIESTWLPISEKDTFVGQPQWLNNIGWVVPCHIPELMMINGVQDTYPHEFRVCSVNNAGRSAWSEASEPLQLRSVHAFQTNIPPPVEELMVLDVGGSQAPGKSEKRSQCRVCWEVPVVLAELPDPPSYAVQIRDTSPTSLANQLALAAGGGVDDDGWREVEFYLQSQKAEGAAFLTGSRRCSLIRSAARDSMPIRDSIQNSLTEKRPSATRHLSLAQDSMVTLAFRRDSNLSAAMTTNVNVDAIVTGLERFPASAVLELRVQVVTPGGASSTTVEIPPVQEAELAPPVTAPEVVKLVSSSPPIVELKFLPAEQEEAIGNEAPRYVLQVSCKQESPPQKELEEGDGWSEFTDIDEIYLSQESIEEDGYIRCLARDFGSEHGFYRFRVCAVSADGVRSQPSPVTDDPLDFTPKDEELNPTDAAQTEEDARPKRPRELQVIRYEKGWCELTWEQRVAAGAAAPCNFEAQECQEDASNNEVWREVRALYVSAQEAAADSLCFRMSAAVFFAENASVRRSVASMPRWKVRVRAEGSEWSAPTQWQQLTLASVPPRTSAPSVVKSELEQYILQWTVPEEEGAVHEVQLQVRKQAGGMFSDWVPVQSYSRHLKDTGRDESEEQAKTFLALVNRYDVAEAAHACPDSEVRFRIRLRSRSGVCGMPSEPSEPTSVQLILSPVPAPRTVDVIGQGQILMDANGNVQSTEFVRLQWLLPSDDEGNADLLDINYNVEMYEEELEFWTSVRGTFIGTDREAHLGTALLPLMTEVGTSRIARFRVVAQSRAPVSGSRDKGFLAQAPATYSEPSATVSWGGPMEAEAPPLIVLAQPMLIVLQFKLPQIAAHLGCAVSAMLELCREEHERQESDDDGSKDGLLSDGDKDGDQMELEFAGEHPVYWQSASNARNMSRSSITITQKENGAEPSGMELAVFDKGQSGCLCEGAVMINASQALSIGDKIRVRLRVCPAGMESAERLSYGVLTQSSLDCIVEDSIDKKSASLRIDYPRWTSMVPVGTEASFIPRLMVGRQAESGSGIDWQEEAADGSGARQLQFHVAAGALPSGLGLDTSTGIISGVCAQFETLQSFTVHASVLRARAVAVASDQSNGALLPAGTAATATLACATVESEAHSTVRELLDNSLLEKLHAQRGAAAVGALLNSPEFLPIYERLCDTAPAAEEEEGQLSNSIIVQAIHRLLCLPEELIAIVNELDEEELMLRLYGDHESSESESSLSSLFDAEESEEEEGEEEQHNEEESHSEEELMPDEKVEDFNVSIQHETKAPEQRRESSAVTSLLAPTPKVKPNPRRHSIAATLEAPANTDSRLSVVMEFGSGGPPTIINHLDGRTEGEEDVIESPRSRRASNALSARSSACKPGKQQRDSVSGRSRMPARLSQRRHSSITQVSPFSDGQSNRRRQSVQNLLAGFDPDTCFADMDLSKYHSHSGEVSIDGGSRRESNADFDRRCSSVLSVADAENIPGLAKKLGGKEDRRRSRMMSQGNANIAAHRLTQRGEAPFLLPEVEVEQEDASANQISGSKMQGSEMNRRKSLVKGNSKLTKAIPRVDITYPGLTPLWPAFVDVEFTPVVRCINVGPSPPKKRKSQEARSSLKSDKGRSSILSEVSKCEKNDVEQALVPGQLKFSIEPLLPAQVFLDETTGVISGSPMREHVAGSQYTITAYWIDSGELAGQCAIAFAVVSTDLASLCNRAYLDHEPPAFRPLPTRQAHEGQDLPALQPAHSPEGDLPRSRSSSATAETSGSCGSPFSMENRQRSKSDWRFGEPQSESRSTSRPLPMESPITLPRDSCTPTGFDSTRGGSERGPGAGRSHTPGPSMVLAGPRSSTPLDEPVVRASTSLGRAGRSHTPGPSMALADRSTPMDRPVARASTSLGGSGRSHTPGPFMVLAAPRSSTPLDQPVARASTSMGGIFHSKLRPGSSLDGCSRPASHSMMTPVDDRGRMYSSPWRPRFTPSICDTPDLVKSRTKVFPLGPSLKERSPIHDGSAHGMHFQPWSAR